jgi:hypothetical protein
MMSPKRFPLNPMDNTMPRFYANFILTFSLKPLVKFSEVHDLLQASFETASDELPLLRRRVFSVAADEKHLGKGRLEAREHPDWTPQVIFNDLSASWPEYEDLVDEGLPQDLLDGAQLVPAVHEKWDLDGEGVAGFVVQANFIHGGLLLSICLFHSLVDGMSSSLLLKMLAKHMRLHQDDDGDAPEFNITPDCCDYDLIPTIWADAGNRLPSPEEFDNSGDDAWRLLGMLPPLSPEEFRMRSAFSLDPMEAPPPPHMTTTIFYVSATGFAKLSDAVSQADSKTTITTNDALMALLWRCIMRARQAADPDNPAYTKPGALAELDTTLDGRLLFGEPLPWTYMGTLVFIATTRMPLSALVSPSTSLVEVANTIRQAVNSITKERLHSSYGLAAAMPDYSTARHPFATFEGAEACFTSFLGLSLMELRFGGKLFKHGGLVDYLRPPRREFDVVCRRCVVLPQRPAGGFEVLLSLKDKEMEFLEEDPEFARFAQFLCH